MKRKLLVLPAAALFDDSVRPYILRRGNLRLVKAYLEAMNQNRAACIEKVVGPERFHEGFIDSWSSPFCCKVRLQPTAQPENVVFSG